MRTITMTLVGVAHMTVAAVLAYFFVRVVLPSLSTDQSAVAFVPIFAVFVVLFGAFGVASLLWHGSRKRAPFWLAAAVPGVLFLVMFGPEVAYSLGNPAEPSGFVPGLMAMIAAAVVVGGGLVAYVEVRRGASILSSERRAPVLVASLGAVLAGAALTSLIAGSTSASTGTVGHAPTTTALVVAENSAFDRPSISTETGGVLGLFLVNRDTFAHSFDIDSLGIHVPMPPDSTSVITIPAAAAGTHEFYCSLLGHRDAGMAGTFTVD